MVEDYGEAQQRKQLQDGKKKLTQAVNRLVQLV